MAAERLGEVRQRTENKLIMDLLYSSTGEYNCESGANGLSVTEISAKDILTLQTSLASRNIPKFLPQVPAGMGEGTRPIGASYCMIIPTEMETTLRELDEFIPVQEYGTNSVIGDFEIGAVHNVRFFSTTSARVFRNVGGTGNDIGQAIIFGKDCFARIQSDAESNSVRIGNPYERSLIGMRTYLTLLMTQAEVITQDNGVIKVNASLKAA